MQIKDGEIIDSVIVIGESSNAPPASVKLLIDAGNENYIRIQIPLDSIEEAQKLVRNCINTDNNLKNNIKIYLERFSYIWDQNYDYIVKKIKIVQDLDDKGFLKDDVTKYVFKWSLVRQECEMYCLIGEEVDPKDFKALSKKRGFDDNMKEFVIYIMKHIGLGGNL